MRLIALCSRFAFACAVVAGLASGTASGANLLSDGERLISEGRNLVARGQAKILEGQRLVQQARAGQVAAKRSLDEALEAVRKADELAQRGQTLVSRGRFSQGEGERDLAYAQREAGRLNAQLKEVERDGARAQDLRRMSADALARGDVVTATRLGQQAQAQEKASGFRREALQRELGFANAILLRSVERLRRARIDQFEGQGLEVRGKAIGEQSRRKLETARELEKKTR